VYCSSIDYRFKANKQCLHKWLVCSCISETFLLRTWFPNGQLNRYQYLVFTLLIRFSVPAERMHHIFHLIPFHVCSAMISCTSCHGDGGFGKCWIFTFMCWLWYISVHIRVCIEISRLLVLLNFSQSVYNLLRIHILRLCSTLSITMLMQILPVERQFALKLSD
jgi:hypothetical protein